METSIRKLRLSQSWWINTPGKTKLRLNEMQSFYFLVKFRLVLIYVLTVYRSKSSSASLKKEKLKKCLIHYLHFSFEKNAAFQVLKDFSVENFETTPSTFLPKFSSEIHLSLIINYRCSIFTLYLTLGVLSLVCLISLTDTNDLHVRREMKWLFFLFSTSIRSWICI